MHRSSHHQEGECQPISVDLLPSLADYSNIFTHTRPPFDDICAVHFVSKRLSIICSQSEHVNTRCVFHSTGRTCDRYYTFVTYHKIRSAPATVPATTITGTIALATAMIVGAAQTNPFSTRNAPNSTGACLSIMGRTGPNPLRVRLHRFHHGTSGVFVELPDAPTAELPSPGTDNPSRHATWARPVRETEMPARPTGPRSASGGR